jgi:hypothetical protein
MTRSEVKKQIADGWLSKHVAVRMSGLFLNRSGFDEYTKLGVFHTAMNDDGTRLYRLLDILSFAEKTAQELLDKNWPVTKRKAEIRVQTVKAFTTDEQQRDFRQRWHVLHRYFGDLMSNRASKFGYGELRIFYKLMDLAHYYNTSQVMLTLPALRKLAKLGGDELSDERGSLEYRGLLDSKRNGNEGWIFTLLNPRTGRPFDADLSEIAPELLVKRAALDSWDEGKPSMMDLMH